MALLKACVILQQIGYQCINKQLTTNKCNKEHLLVSRIWIYLLLYYTRTP